MHSDELFSSPLVPIWNYLNGGGCDAHLAKAKLEYEHTLIAPLLTPHAIDDELEHVRDLIQDHSLTPIGKFVLPDCQVIVYASREYHFVAEYDGDYDEQFDGFYRIGDTVEEVKKSIVDRHSLCACPLIQATNTD